MISIEETYKYDELEIGDIVFPYCFIADGVVKDKILYAGCPYCFEVRDKNGGLVPFSYNLKVFGDSLLAGKIGRFIWESAIRENLYIKIGRVRMGEMDGNYVPIYESYFQLLNGEKYKVFNFMGKPYIYRVDSRFPFVHIRKFKIYKANYS